MLKSFEKLGANMSVKVHFLQNQLSKFQYNLSDYSEAQVNGSIRISR